MDNCIFCQIVNQLQSGDQSVCHKIYEDDNFVGFLDIRPLNPGNSLLISTKHYRWVYDVPNFGLYWETARKIGLATKEALQARSINFLTIGDKVPHAHIRIVPRFIDDGSVIALTYKKIDQGRMEKIASQIRALLL